MPSLQTRVFIFASVLTLILGASIGVIANPIQDPDDDTIGWENGYWYNESITTTNETEELKAIKNRAMARVEYLTDTEFDTEVPITLKTRDEYKKSSPFMTNRTEAYTDWNNQVWEALFILDEQESTDSQRDNLTKSQVTGYYSPQNDTIVVIMDKSSPSVPESTLVHELVHALQDEEYNLSQSRFTGETQDEQLAIQSLIEGHATYIEAKYQRACQRDIFECRNSPPSTGQLRIDDGYRQVTLFPYTAGYRYVRDAPTTNRQSAQELFENPPSSTSQVIRNTAIDKPKLDIHPRDGWQRISNTAGRNGSDSIGEASMAVMFRQASANTDTQFSSSVRPYANGFYKFPFLASYNGDIIVPYETQSGKQGYIWKIKWQSKSSATAFRSAYTRLLREYGATQRGNHSWVIQDSGFADGFIVRQDNNIIYIANAPTVSDADGLLVFTQSPVVPTQDSYPLVVLTIILGVFVAIYKRVL